MSDGPPPRLLDDPNAPEDARADLAATRDQPRRYDAVAGLAQLKASIAAGAGVAGTGAVGMSTAKSWGIGLLITAVLGGGAITAIELGVFDAPPAEPARDVAPAPTHGSPEAAPEPSEAATDVEPAPLPDEPVVDEPASETPEAEAVPSVGAVNTADVPPVDPDVRLREEIAHLQQLRSLSSSDPATAVREADRAQHRFAGGMFSEERSAIAIFALDRLGRRAELERRAARFLRRYPNGPFSERVRRLVDP